MKILKSGVWLLLLAMSLTPAVDGIAKNLGQNYAPMFIAFLRYFGAGLVALAAARVLRHPIHIPRGDWLGQVLRTALIMGAMTALIAALSLVPLANAVGGFLIAPIVSTALSIALMGEKLTTERAIGSALSIVGAVVILRPEGSLEIGTLLALLGGTLLGCYLAATRAATSSADALSTLVVQCLLGSAMLAPFAFAGGIPPMSVEIPVGMLGLGVLSALCHFLTVTAYRRSEASLLSPFLYFNIIAAVLVGFLWFGETPTMISLAGLGGIAFGGLVAIAPGNALNFARMRGRLAALLGAGGAVADGFAVCAAGDVPSLYGARGRVATLNGLGRPVADRFAVCAVADGFAVCAAGDVPGLYRARGRVATLNGLGRPVADRFAVCAAGEAPGLHGARGHVAPAASGWRIRAANFTDTCIALRRIAHVLRLAERQFDDFIDRRGGAIDQLMADTARNARFFARMRGRAMRI